MATIGLGFDIFARDRGTSAVAAVGKSAKQTAVEIEAANLKVERATKRLADAERIHGKTSFEARTAANQLSKAQLGLAKAQDTTATSTERAGKGLDRFKAVSVAAGAVVGSALFGIGERATDVASDIAESQSKVQVVFGRSSQAVTDLGETSAKSLGISKRAALDAAGTFGNLFVSLKLPQAEASKMSVRMVQLAADMASFNNSTPEEALEALRSGLVGETEPLRRFGVNINDAALRQKALELGLVSTTKDVLPAAVKAQASYALILEQTGTAQGDFARTSDGLANSQRIAKARAEDLAGALGAQLLPAVNGTLSGLLGMADFVQRNERVMRPLGIAVGSLAAGVIAVNLATRAWTATTAALTALSAGYDKVTASATRAQLAASGTAKALAVVGTALAAVQLGQWGGQAAVASVQTDKLAGSLGNLAARGELGADALRLFDRSGLFGVGASKIETTADALDAFGTSAYNALDQGWDARLGRIQDFGRAEGKFREQTEQLDAAFAAMVQQGNVAEAHETMAQFERAATRAGVPVASLRAQFPQYAEALKAASSGQGAAAGTATGLAGAAGEAADGMGEEKSAAEQLRTALDKLTGKHIAADEAAISYEASVDDLTASIKDNGRSLNISTEAGRKNRTAVINAAKAATDHMVALRDEGASEEVVRQKGIEHRNQLIRVARQLGLNKTETQKLIDRYYAVPKRIDTKASVDTRKALSDAREFSRYLRSIRDEGVTVTAYAVLSDQWADYKGPGGRRGDGPGVERSGPPVMPRVSMTRAIGDGAGKGSFGRVEEHLDANLDRLAGRFRSNLQRMLAGSGALGSGAANGWRAQWRAVHAAFPGATLHSSFRPGAITASGNQSYHALGRAIDVTPSMTIFEWIRSRYGRNTKELIYSPAGGRQLKNGAPHYYTGAVRAQHWNHVHWAYDRGGLARGRGWMPKTTSAPERVLSPAQTRAFEQLVPVLAQQRGAASVTINASFPNYLGDRRELVSGLRSLVSTGHLDFLAPRR